MPIKVACRSGQSFAANDNLAGRTVKCPKCGSALQVPAPAAPLAPAPMVGGIGSLLEEEGITAHTGIRCPKCEQPLANNAVLCTRCGFHLQTGQAGRTPLTPEERQGLQLFETKGKCAVCHPHKRDLMGQPPVFTDWGYDNIGVPANPANPFYTNSAANPKGKTWVDEGLGGFLAETAQWKQYAQQSLGKHRTPTLSNVDLRPSAGW